MSSNTSTRKVFLNDFIVSLLFFSPTIIVLAIAFVVIAAEGSGVASGTLLASATVFFFIQFSFAHKSRFLRKFLANQE